MSRPTHHYVCLFSINGILDYIGRIDCEDTGRECLDEDSNSRECRQDLGDARVLPDANLLVHEILDFFSDNFGFNAQETVALMGVSYLLYTYMTFCALFVIIFTFIRLPI